jgi:hypothetical protein
MTKTPTISQLLTIAEMDLLLAGGVDNWEWYGDALEEYEESSDVIEDAENFMSALNSGGVDNWEWYGESITGLSEYEDYLNELSDLNEAISIRTFKNQLEEAEKAVVKPVVVEEPVVEKIIPKGGAAQALYVHIVDRFGDERADEIFELALENGIWKYNRFTKEFKKATEVIKKGVEDPLEKARQALFDAVLKNGKLDIFLDEIASK